jgi:hypothetical protein
MFRMRALATVSGAFIVGLLSGCTPSYTAPTAFAVTNDSVTKVVEQAIAADKEATQLDGPASAHCNTAKTCQIAYTIEEPLGETSGMDGIMIQPTRQIWKTLFADPQFTSGTITVSGPVVSVGGTSSTGVYFTLTCDRHAEAQINWDRVDGNGLRTFCVYSPELKDLPGIPGA